jgi:hypothetical protein
VGYYESFAVFKDRFVNRVIKNAGEIEYFRGFTVFFNEMTIRNNIQNDW